MATRTANANRTSTRNEAFVANLVAAKPDRSERAKEYEEKVAGVLNVLMRAFAGNPATVADAAAVIEYGPALASKTGDLAAHDATARKIVDFITTGSDNPYVAVMVAALPLAAQILRNHESTEAKPFEVKIPFTKKTIRPKFRIRLRNPLLRAMTSSPGALVRKIFTNPEYVAALHSQGIDVAHPEFPKNVAAANGNPGRG